MKRYFFLFQAPHVSYVLAFEECSVNVFLHASILGVRLNRKLTHFMISSFLVSVYSRMPKTSRRTFFRACVFTIFLPHIWNEFIFFCGFYNVFLVPCIVLVSEMLSFTMVIKFNYFLLWKLHRFVLYEVVSKASRGSLLQQWFIRFLVFFQSNVFRKRVFFECSECIHRSNFIETAAMHSEVAAPADQAQSRTCVHPTCASAKKKNVKHTPPHPLRSTLNTGYITGLDMCKVCTEAVHCVARWTRVTLQVWTCVRYVPKQSIP